jgi:Ser-tRNA(Ala) deacylase AlaX
MRFNILTPQLPLRIFIRLPHPPPPIQHLPQHRISTTNHLERRLHTMASPLTTRTDPLYQKDSTLHLHTSPITSLHPLSSLPEETRLLFKPPPDIPSEPMILTTSSTIFHAQGGGQPSDVGTIVNGTSSSTFHVTQVRKPTENSAILHSGYFAAGSELFTDGEACEQNIDVAKRTLHSRIHTAGHVIGVAVNQLISSNSLPQDIKDGKASHYPGAAFVEFTGLIPGTAKEAIQARVDELVKRDLDVGIHFWSEQEARQKCLGADGGLKGDEDGVRVVQIGEEGSYPCGGTHVGKLGECGRIVVRNVKRQKGVSKIGYEVVDA